MLYAILPLYYSLVLPIIIMLSLKEQISSFRSQIQRLNLAGYTSLFQSHISSQEQPSLKEVITENNFLVESVKMMSSVFLNYCWLNERVYSKIMDHELGLHDEQARLKAVTYSVEHKLEDSLRNFKALHQDSLTQNKRNKQIVEVGLKSICQEIQTKVTDAQLTDKIREILRKYDQGDLLDQNEEFTLTSNTMLTSTIVQKSHVEPRNISYVQGKHNSQRKVGKVAYEDHYRLKDQLDSQLAKLKKQIHEAEHQIHQNKQRTIHCAALLELHEAEIKRQKGELTRMHGQQNNSSKYLLQEIEKTSLRLQDKTSEEEWKKRLSLFQMKSVDPLRAQVNDSLMLLRGEMKRIKEETYLKTNSAQGQLQQFAKELGDFKAKVAKEVEDVAVLELKFSDFQQRIHHQTTEITSKTEAFMQETRKADKEFEKNLKREVLELRNTIQKLSNSVEEKAFKAIAKKIQSSFHCFQTDLMESREIVKSLTTGLGLANEEISSMKDLLSRKANFSDVVHYIEGKADKHDIREIRTRLNDNSQSHPVMVRQLSETATARHERSLIESPPHRLREILKAPRTEFIAPVPASQREHRREKSTSSRADLQGTARRLLVREGKKKVMKSYGSLINDLRK